MRLGNIRKYAAASALAAAVVLTAAGAAGCVKKEKPAETVQTTGAQTKAPDESSDGAGESTADSGTLEAAERTMPQIRSEEAVGMFTGTVKDAAMNTLVAANSKYPDGITFSKEDAAVSLADGLKLGEEVTVFYRGALNEKEAMTAELVRDKRDGDESGEAGVISGEVLGIGMSAVTIRTKEGKEISFEQDPKPVNLTDGPEEGTEVSIFYSCKKGEQWYVPELITK